MAEAIGTYNRGYVFCIVLITSFTALIAGYQIVILNTFTDMIATTVGWGGATRAFFIGLITSALPIGALISCVFMKSLLACGRLLSVKVCTLSIVAGAIICSISLFLAKKDSYGFVYLLLIGRVVVGFGVGFCFAAVPMYIREVSPSHCRGAYLTFQQLGIVVGILIAFSIPFSFPSNINGKLGLYGLYIFAFALLFGIIQFLLQMFIFKYDSPIYYVSMNKEDPAREFLYEIYGRDSEVEEQMNQCRVSIEKERNEVASSNTAVAVGCGVAIFQQVTGINAILFYSVEMFVSRGQTLAKVGTLMIGVGQIIFALVATFTVDRCGRKLLLIIGSALCSFFLLFFGLFYGSYPTTEVIFLFLFLGAFSVSHGPICWVYINEILSTKQLGYASFASWGGALIITLLAPILLNKLGGGLFIIFAILTILCIPFVLLWMRETSGKSEQEIRELFTRSYEPMGIK